jgi:RNA polymerase sigma factor (sigma-70 family)
MKDMMLLVEPLIPPLRRYARSLLRDHAAADDLVQDCLERVISRWHQRRPDGDTRTWVFTILHNLAVNRMRQTQRRGRHVEIDDTVATEFATLPTQQDGLTHRDLLSGLAALPEDQRSVLLLISVENLSYAEAAKVLDVPLGTVMSRLARAREKLLKSMNGENVVPLQAAQAFKLRSVK